MSGGKGGGLLNRLVISPLIGLTLFFTGSYFVLGPTMTADFAKTTTTALGYGAGVTVGSLPTLFGSLKDGQAAADPGGSLAGGFASGTDPEAEKSGGGTGTPAAPLIPGKR